MIAQQTSFMHQRVLLLPLLILLLEIQMQAIAQSSSPSVSDQLISAVLTREATGEPAASFSTETPQIYLRWYSDHLNAGAKIRCIWIAEDVGSAAPANYHVDEATTTANESQTSGMFTLSKPKSDWPEGKYRVEIYVGTQLAVTLPFRIQKPRGD
jgi:hypothetical protein